MDESKITGWKLVIYWDDETTEDLDDMEEQYV